MPRSTAALAACAALTLVSLGCDDPSGADAGLDGGALDGAIDGGALDGGAFDGGPDGGAVLDGGGAPFAETVRDEAYAALDDPTLANPERGIYYWDPRGDDAHTLIGAWLYLGDHCDQELVWDGRGASATSAVLDDYAADLEAHRAAGRKVIFRPRYDTPSSSEVNGCGVFQAETEALTRRHVEAIAAMLAEHLDVIAFVEAGYLGRWGEWNHEGYEPETAPVLVDPSSRRAFLDFVIQTYASAGVPRYVGVRRPVFARELREEHPGSADRVSFYNDCFMTTSSDMGTYSNFESSNPHNFATAEDAIAYAEALTEDAPFGGETCPATTPRWASCDAMVGADSEPAALHMSYLHGAWAPDARSTWEAGGCYDEIRQRLGYRFEVGSVEYPPTVEAGERVRVRVTVRNTGWSRMHNPRRAYLVLRDGAEALRIGEASLGGEVSGDQARDWGPGEDAVIEATFERPPPGTYTLHLALPDPDRPDHVPYAVRLASTREAAPLFDPATADNDLGLTISVP